MINSIIITQDDEKTVNVDFNTASRRAAMILLSIAAMETIENRADYNEFLAIVKKVYKKKEKKSETC